MPQENIVLRGVTKDGDVVFYTGRVNSVNKPSNWVSSDPNQAFQYSIQRARNRATSFNEFTAIHGIHFIAVEYDRVCDAMNQVNAAKR